ncbi:hypothetical protein CALCODRAFT_490930, partial [Calocera cornea HHB12733]
MDDTRAIAERQLQGLSRAPDAYVKELHRFLQQRPGESNFTVFPTPKKGYGSVTCMRPGCSHKQVHLAYDNARFQGGLNDGIGSLTPYETHCDVYHPPPSGYMKPEPTQATPLSARGSSSHLAGRSSILDQLDGRAPATLPRVVKREVGMDLSRSVPSKRPVASLADDSDDDDVIDLTMDEPTLLQARKRARLSPKARLSAILVEAVKRCEEETMKREPLNGRDINSLAARPTPSSEDFDDDDVIDLTMDEIPTPASRKARLAPIFKREAMDVEEVNDRALTQLAPAAAPTPALAAAPTAAPAPVDAGISPARIQQILKNIRVDQAKVQKEITQLKRKARLGGRPPSSALAEKEALLAELKKEEHRTVQTFAARSAAIPESPFARMGNGGPSSLPKKEEPSSAVADLLARAVAGPSRGFGAQQPVAGPNQALPQPYAAWPGPSPGAGAQQSVAGPSQALTHPYAAWHAYHMARQAQAQPPAYGAQAVPGGVQQVPGIHPGPFGQTTFNQFVQTAAQNIGNGLHAGFNAMQNFAHMAAAHVPGGSAIEDAMDQLIGAGLPALGAGRLWGDDGGEEVDDAFNRRDNDAVNKFILAAGNAATFDASADVQKAMKGLGLQNQQQMLRGMDCVLLPHQLIAVKWMHDLETDQKFKRNGGILADEMGLGKTVQMIALMCRNPPIKGEPQGTLIVAPLSLLEQWKAEILDKTNGDQRIHIYHSTNPNKVKSKYQLKEYNVVITTYGTLAGEMPKSMMLQQKPTIGELEDAKKKAGLLFRINWHRIVLDEAHNIRNRPTRQSQAVTHLDAKYRWCLTGTPVINSLADLYGYFRFIRLRPWNDWRDYNDHVAGIQKKQPQLASERAQGILQTCLLRRKKDSMLDGKRLIELTNKEVVQTVLEFSPEERQIYEFVQGKIQAVFNRYLRAGTVLKNYSHILVLILRLKQLCCHPSLIQEQNDDQIMRTAGDDDKELSDEANRAVQLMGAAWVDQLKAKLFTVMAERVKTEQRSLDEEVDNDVCPVCFDTMTDPMVTACSHIYCNDCVEKLFEKAMEPGPEYKAAERPCPSCRQPISQEKLFRRSAFEPSDDQLAGILGRPGVKDEPFVQDEAYVKSEPFVKEESDDDLDMPSVDELISLGISPKQAKGKGRAQERVKKGRVKREQGKKRKGRSSLSESEDDDSEGSLDDFIVHTDEDEDEKDQRLTNRKKNKGKQRAIKPDPFSEDEIVDVDNLDDDSEEDIKPYRQKVTLKSFPKMSKFLPSTKMKSMMESITTWANEHPTDKVMVLSQFTSCLALVARYLDENDVSYVRYQGDMKKGERDQSIYQFQRKKGGPRVMLMSLKAGGVGLNLTRGNRVIALDLAWSEAVEHQAYDRVHRLGQTKDVLVQRLIIKDTIEDELLKIQARKRALADGSLGEGGGRKMGRLSVREIAALFGIHDLRRH